MAGRRAKLDPSWVERPPPRAFGPTPRARDPGGPAAPRICGLPPVFDEIETFARASAARALDAAHASGRHPVWAAARWMVPPSWTSARSERVAEVVREVLSDGGVPLAWQPEWVGPNLRAVFSVAMDGRSEPVRALYPSDRLVLSKPLGNDVLFEAYLHGERTVSQTRAWVRAGITPQPEVAQWLQQTSGTPGVQLAEGGLAEACWLLAEEGQLDAVLDASRLPALPGATEFLFSGRVPEGCGANRRRLGRQLSVARGVPETAANLALAPEWAGGILVAVPRDGPVPSWGTTIGELRNLRAERPRVRLLGRIGP